MSSAVIFAALLAQGVAAAETPARFIGAPGQMILQSDYPPIAMIDDVEGATAFTVDIDTSGRVSRCAVTAGSGSALLDSTTCALVTKRARFTPAQRAGVAVPGRWSNRVRWVLPRPSMMVDPRYDGPARVSAKPNAAYASLSPGAWLSAARMDGEIAATFALLDIDRGGTVVGCTIETSTAAAARTALACPGLRGQDLFTPGFDREGNAVPDRVRVKIRW